MCPIHFFFFLDDDLVVIHIITAANEMVKQKYSRESGQSLGGRLWMNGCDKEAHDPYPGEAGGVQCETRG